jgi:Ca2+/Na+ antiporter
MKNGVKIERNDLKEDYKMTSNSWWFVGGGIALVLLIILFIVMSYKSNKGSRKSSRRY